MGWGACDVWGTCFVHCVAFLHGAELRPVFTETYTDRVAEFEEKISGLQHGGFTHLSVQLWGM